MKKFTCIVLGFMILLLPFKSLRAQVYATSETHTANGICIGCNVNSFGNSVDAPRTNYETMYLTVAVLGAGITQKLYFPSSGSAGNYVGIVVEDVGGATLNAAALNSISMTTFKSGISNGDTRGSSAVSISLVGSTQYKMEWAAGYDFDQVEVKFNAGILGALSSIRVYYAYYITTGPLPIELLSFHAKPAGDRVILDWVTASEQNNDHFTIEKSSDAITYTEVAKVEGSGTSSQMHSYSCEDRDPAEGTSYYRLKQTDFNGAYTYFKIAAVSYTASGQEYGVYPNPYSGNELHFVIPFDNTELRVLNAVGQLVFTKVYSQSGNYTEDLRSITNEIPAGVYFISFHSNAGSNTIREIIQ